MLGVQNRQRGETDTGDPATLFDFISWTQEHYRADHYMVILAGHGAGTEEDFLLRDDTAGGEGIRPSNPTSSLSMRELRKVFEKVKEKLKSKLTSSEWTSV